MCTKQMRQLFLLLYLCISDLNKVMIFILSEVLDLFSDMIWKDNNKIITFGVKNCSYRHVVHILVGLLLSPQSKCIIALHTKLPS